MKKLLVLTSVLVCACALPPYEERIDNNDDPQNYKNIEILLLESAVDQDGGYSFSFENDDGSRVTQEGQHKIIDDDHTVERIHGAYSYNDVNGQPVSLTYTADENGFRPVGAHLPTSPPIPLEILRSLKYLATAKPFVDDQLYDYKPKKKVFRGRQYSTLNAVQRSRNNLRSNSFSAPLADETPSKVSLRTVADELDTKPETTSETIPEVSSETPVETTSESVETTTDGDKKPTVESAVDIVNESKKKINDALKESIEKTSQITQSATRETAAAAISAIRGEVQKLNDSVKSQVTKINDKISGAKTEIDKQVSESAKQSRGVIKYTGIASDAVSAADQALVDIAPTDETLYDIGVRNL
ncbi:hypothetical protein HA402_016067 [Bradysia odoriphaga]|nr:hypothetical protein HA402_016067 [Bradysia odoriphaga]